MAALSAIKYMRGSQAETNRAMAQLASGSRLATSDEDPASFSISEHLRGQASGLRASRLNADNAISLIQVAEGGLNEQNNIIIRLRELAIQAASDTVSDVERQMLNDEFQQLSSEVDRVSKTTQFGSNKLLIGSGKKFEFQVGAYGGKENKISYSLEANTSSDSLGLNHLGLADKDDAVDAIADLDEALSKIGVARASFGSLQSRLQHAVDHLLSHEISIEEARSKMADTDVADAVTKMTKGKIQTQYQIAVLSQANILEQSALRLLD
jgi:flagellin